jgi:nitrate reductase beta subunit
MLDRFSKKAEVNDSGLSEELNKKIMDFRVYLRTSLVALEKVAKVTDVMGLTRNKFHEKYKNFLCISLPSY